MSDGADGNHVGPNHPPRHTRWKKGQSGNPGPKRRKKLETAAEMIDRLLSAALHISVNGEKRRATTLTAVMYALYQKAITGNIRAKRALLKYKEFANTHSEGRPQVIFVDTDYTRALANRRKGGGDE